MPCYVLLTRLKDAGRSRTGAAKVIGSAIRGACTSFGRLRRWRWIESFALEAEGADFLDVFELPDDEQAQHLRKAIAEAGIAEVEVMRATRALRTFGTDGDLLGTFRCRGDDVEEASRESFPASDAPAWR